MENKPENTPESPSTEIKGADEVALSLPVVHMSNEEFQNLDALGRDHKVVKNWLEERGVGESGQFIASIDGEDVVVDAGEDFMTVDRDATDAWNGRKTEEYAANAARSMLAIEDSEPEEVSYEVESSLSVEELQEIGEEGLRAAEVESPEYSEEETMPVETESRAGNLRHIYEQNVLDIRIEAAQNVEKVISNLQESKSELSAAESRIIRQTSAILENFTGVIRNNENYSNEALRTAVRQVADDLHRALSSTRLIGEQTPTRIREALRSFDSTLADSFKDAEARDADYDFVCKTNGIEISSDTVVSVGILKQASKEVTSTPQLKENLNKLDTALATLSQETLPVQLRRLEEVIHRSYDRPMEPSELAHIAAAIRETVESDILREAIEQTDADLGSTIDQMRRMSAALNPRAQ